MADEQMLNELLAELGRVGVDPHQFSAVIDLPSDAVLRALRELPDAAGPAAVLAALRRATLFVPPATPPYARPAWKRDGE